MVSRALSQSIKSFGKIRQVQTADKVIIQCIICIVITCTVLAQSSNVPFLINIWQVHIWPSFLSPQSSQPMAGMTWGDGNPEVHTLTVSGKHRPRAVILELARESSPLSSPLAAELIRESSRKFDKLKIVEIHLKTYEAVMKLTKFSNPFKPGSGHLPPYLAGRESEQDVFRNNLVDMSAGISPPAPTVLYGPRGMGKTVLLRWFKNEVEPSGAKKDLIRVVWVTPNQLESPSDLWKCLMPPETLKSKMTPEGVTAGFNVEVLAASATWKAKDLFKQTFQNTLIDQCKKQPLILLMDEAHKMDADLCNNLLNLHQIISPESPFMLVLAGTPGLHNFLSGVNASFVERSRNIGLGRLDEQSSADAISKPFQEQGIQITDDALSIIIEDSQCYPYFLQEWGSSLWEEADKENLTCITDEQVVVAKPNITIIKKDFYNKRRDTLDVLGLRSTAVAIAQAFQDTKEMTKDAIMEIITDNLSVDSLNTQSVTERLQTFIDHDFIWRPQGSDFYEPGIPSFMTHILDLQTPLAKTK